VAFLSLAAMAAALVALRLGLVHDPPKPSAPAGQVAPTVKRHLPAKPPAAGERVVLIRKADRVLALYREGKLAAAYPVALGPSSAGHKQREGDGRTPEGEYYVCNRNAQSQFHLFLGLSYPSARDAAAGYRAGLITKAQREAIVAANAKHQRPPWDTLLGGEVGIHGGGASHDWTLGCIALEDAAIEELWQVLQVGDPVVVQP